MSLRAEGNAVWLLLLAKLAIAIQVRNAASLMLGLLRIQSGVWVNTTRVDAQAMVALSMSGVSSVVTGSVAFGELRLNYGHVTRRVRCRRGFFGDLPILSVRVFRKSPIGSWC